MSVKFCPLSSGSSGNSLVISTQFTNILIDAGFSGKKGEMLLSEMGIDMSQIDALFITHEHVDHIKGAGVISRKYNIPIYATPGTWSAMEASIGGIARGNKRFIYSGEICYLNDLCIKPFSVPHDAEDAVAFSVMTDKHKMTVATDMGYVTDEIKENLKGSDILLIEANHDLDMLINGPYPWPLKKRIMGEKGHISNITCGDTLAEIIDEKLKYIYLGHLSSENNKPHIAYEAVEQILKKSGVNPGKDLSLDVAARYSRSREIIL